MGETATTFDARAVALHRTGNGPPLVLLHCLGVDHRLWPLALGDMERERTLLAYDFPGHGESPVPSVPYGIANLSAQLASVLDCAGIARATIAGISLGGLVAQDFAASFPTRVDRLVLMDTTAHYTEELRTMWAVRAEQARKDGVTSLVPGLLEIWFTKDFVAQNPPAVRYVRDTLERCSGEGYARACEALAAADLRGLAAKISAPTLVLCGDQDIPSFLDAARWLAANIADAKLAWLAPARHASILEQPDKFRRTLRDFLA